MSRPRRPTPRTLRGPGARAQAPGCAAGLCLRRRCLLPCARCAACANETWGWTRCEPPLGTADHLTHMFPNNRIPYPYPQRTCSSAVTAASSCAASGEPASAMGAPPAAPLARPITVSLVLVSPSTDICARAARRHRRCRQALCLSGHLIAMRCEAAAWLRAYFCCMHAPQGRAGGQVGYNARSRARARPCAACGPLSADGLLPVQPVSALPAITPPQTERPPRAARQSR